ncbi:MAG: class I SAM-dependent methyltransferase [Armatimonadetes bacterium]|nr:class I SAM-dependent methyltransferase [Armatimonadota bacterium]
MRLAATTARIERFGQRPVAEQLALEMGIPFLERRNRGVERILAEEGLDGLIVVNDEDVQWVDGAGGRFFWHPNMALVRIRSAARCGLPDPIARAGRLEPGDRVLDATLGLGADAIVASAHVGETGVVIGIEVSPVIAGLVRNGLATYQHKLNACMRRIRVVCGNYEALLDDPELVGDGWATIFFDPMFEHTVEGSNGLDGVRRLACYDRLTPEIIERARRLARRAVVVKGRGNDPWLGALEPDHWVQGRHRRVAYAVFEPK